MERLRDSDYITKAQAESMLSDCIALIKLLTSIVKTTFECDKKVRSES
ncbi:hypothetical protein HMPREF9420_2073 [Segatella salivae DSM 15606]|uniref:Four helix bundle protein n=1 Tax=Segatella salivae DSM 15606 TaxID=888832 RepID=E6MRF5_9BACT|nr:hypothetical protein HMPREF9420_2073 [Segatella salivae DSM 15606]